MCDNRIVIKALHIACVFVLLSLFNCSPKVVKTTTKEDYKEDLSAVRPPIDSVVVEAASEKIKEPYVKPSNDITRELGSLVDSLSVDNKNKRVNFYTIQVYVGSNRNEANEARSRVYNVIPDETPKLEYSQPNYRVKVGTFIDRLDAHKTLTKLKNTFPGAILLTERANINK